MIGQYRELIARLRRSQNCAQKNKNIGDNSVGAWGLLTPATNITDIAPVRATVSE